MWKIFVSLVPVIPLLVSLLWVNHGFQEPAPLAASLPPEAPPEAPVVVEEPPLQEQAAHGNEGESSDSGVATLAEICSSHTPLVRLLASHSVTFGKWLTDGLVLENQQNSKENDDEDGQMEDGNEDGPARGSLLEAFTLLLPRVFGEAGRLRRAVMPAVNGTSERSFLGAKTPRDESRRPVFQFPPEHLMAASYGILGGAIRREMRNLAYSRGHQGNGTGLARVRAGMLIDAIYEYNPALEDPATMAACLETAFGSRFRESEAFRPLLWASQLFGNLSLSVEAARENGSLAGFKSEKLKGENLHLSTPLHEIPKDFSVAPAEVLVVGGGVSGLMMAVEAYRSGSVVHVIDGARGPGGAADDASEAGGGWVDFVAGAWFPGVVGFLEGLGVSPRTVPGLRKTDMSVTAPRAALLAHLRRVVAMIGVRIQAGRQVVALCPSSPTRQAFAVVRNLAARLSGEEELALEGLSRAERCGPALAGALGLNPLWFREGDDLPVFGRVPFDVVVGADGPGSRVREDLGVEWVAQRSLLFGAREEPLDLARPVAESHVTVTFERDPGTGGCPAVKHGPRGHDPTYAGFSLPEVVALRKRFYDALGHCSVDVYLAPMDPERAARLALEAAKLVVDSPAALELSGPPAVRPNITVSLAVDPVVLLAASRKQNQAHRWRGYALLVGQSSLHSPTRLSLAASNAVVQVEDAGLFLRLVNHHGRKHLSPEEAESEAAKQVRDVAVQKADRERLRLKAFAQLEVSTLFYETACGLVVGFAGDEKNILVSQVLYAREAGDYADVDYKKLTSSKCKIKV
jgi:2-polyprenyl-6-methoxyphenol hydroxylase-like FAD-dependent oxidoreductase